MSAIRHEVVLSNGDRIEVIECDLDEIGYDCSSIMVRFITDNDPYAKVAVWMDPEPDERFMVKYEFLGEREPKGQG